MTKIKNIAYFEVEAVMTDVREKRHFNIGEVKDVPESEVVRLTKERYPGILVVEEFKIEEPKQEIVQPESISEATEPSVDIAKSREAKPRCDICGKEYKTETAIKAHKTRTHK